MKNTLLVMTILLSVPVYASSSNTQELSQKLTNGAVVKAVAVQDQQPQGDAVVHVEPVAFADRLARAAKNEIYDELVLEPKLVAGQIKALFVGDKPFKTAFWELFVTGGDEQED